ncbi:hypothetical protein EDC32_1011276 [Laceyella sacchari]|jgi:hypothetical protein|nr:hypothetical protein [Laceyella sacchari]TCW41610.1 hypothetical protein EDC32_1011276 [Laceyella sacchari]
MWGNDDREDVKSLDGKRKEKELGEAIVGFFSGDTSKDELEERYPGLFC